MRFLNFLLTIFFKSLIQMNIYYKSLKVLNQNNTKIYLKSSLRLSGYLLNKYLQQFQFKDISKSSIMALKGTNNRNITKNTKFTTRIVTKLYQNCFFFGGKNCISTF